MTTLFRNTSTSVNVPTDIVDNFIANPDFTYLISFPRSGSHWLRMLMELYFEKPSLVRIFYYKDAERFTCYHRHDEDLSIHRSNVIYLYRDPVDTIYSQLNYYNENMCDNERINYWAILLGKHFNKWLIQETFTRRKTIITYEGMMKDMETEFRKVVDHFSESFDAAKLQEKVKLVTKKEVKDKTSHDPQVMNLTDDYSLKRNEFRERYEETILDIIYLINPALKTYLAESL